MEEDVFERRAAHQRRQRLDAARVHRGERGVTVVGVKSPGKDFTYATAETVISNHDLIIVSGNSADIEKFASLQS